MSRLSTRTLGSPANRRRAASTIASEASTASTVPRDRCRKRSSVTLPVPHPTSTAASSPLSPRRRRKTSRKFAPQPVCGAETASYSAASHSSGKLPTFLALSHIMRHNVCYMNSIEGSREESKSVSGVGVLDKSVVILSFIAEGGPATLAEVVGGTGLPRPTAHRLLSALEAHRLVGRNGGRYSLGVRLLAWGSGAAGSSLVE